MKKRILSALASAVIGFGLLFSPMAGQTAHAEEGNSGDIMVLYTSDVHCGINMGLGYGGVAQIRETMENKGYTTLLVDNGDAIQGDIVGTASKGDSIIRLMNKAGYDAAIPGNHEFDYGVENFLSLTEKAEFPYLSCNLEKEGEKLLSPYKIFDVARRKVAFVGVTTPETITSSTPKYFQNENGEFIYDFCRDESGQLLYDAVQSAVDDARNEGADYVFVMGHVGYLEKCRPWTYDDIISNTEGIDVFLDGHSHDAEQVVMKNRNGEDVIRTACGTKLSNLGYVTISAEGEINNGLFSWNNSLSATELFNISNEVQDEVLAVENDLNDTLSEVVANSDVALTIYDPEEKMSDGSPLRIVRHQETNLGDLCADAYRDQLGTDIGLCNGGGIRTNIDKGEITLGEIMNVHPFNNEMYIVTATGQQILDALEWSSSALPNDSGIFLQVSGLSYEVYTFLDSRCTSDENGMFTGVDGEYRVKNVLVNGEPLDLEKTYTVGSSAYILHDNGGGMTAFDECEGRYVGKLDNQVLVDYIQNSLNGSIGEEYSDPYGSGRIVIIEGLME
ncbi:MAG: bifunctional UDP-sugar hydrolase/5'-nucleotidase [Clostridia bacterium]|nr:bifunctional UDP-sugar hydrolase/5'-nucleotidase [Clostridia bacterium]